MSRLSPEYPFYLHDTPVKVIGVGPAGTWVEDRGGERYLIYTTGKRVYECLSGFVCLRCDDCPRCSWKFIEGDVDER